MSLAILVAFAKHATNFLSPSKTLPKHQAIKGPPYQVQMQFSYRRRLSVRATPSIQCYDCIHHEAVASFLQCLKVIAKNKMTCDVKCKPIACRRINIRFTSEQLTYTSRACSWGLSRLRRRQADCLAARRKKFGCALS